ncbi:MAG: hypothetical protein AAEJ04_04830 [Planctomycetota bacterium]
MNHTPQILRVTSALLILTSLSILAPTLALSQSSFNRGDCNSDNSTDIADAILGLGILFSGDGPPICEDACDVNDDGNLDIGDPIYLLANLFSSGNNPPPPNSCGTDPTSDSLTCASGCTPATEDCSNGVDDDGDTDIDCADSDCTGDPACAPPLTFEFDIYPIFDSECNFCHGPPTNFGGLDMTTGGSSAAYTRIVNTPSGECSALDLIEPGVSANSWLFRKIDNTHVEAANAAGCDPVSAGSQMPLGAFCCLTPQTIEKIQSWIDDGANP